MKKTINNSLENMINNVGNTMSAEELEGWSAPKCKPISEDEVPKDILERKNSVYHKTLINKIFTVAKHTAKATKAIYKKIGELLTDEKFLAGFQAGIYYMIYSIAISNAIKKVKEKKNS